MRNEKVQKLTLTALMAALSYVIFTFLQIKVTLPGGSATSPNTENGIKWCEHAILWEFEVFEDCGNCIAMEQSGYISEWQNLLLTLTSS